MNCFLIFPQHSSAYVSFAITSFKCTHVYTNAKQIHPSIYLILNANLPRYRCNNNANYIQVIFAVYKMQWRQRVCNTVQCHQQRNSRI